MTTPVRFRTAAAAVLTSTALLLGGAVATAPAASAAGSCNYNYPDAWWYLNTNGVNFRSGPSTKYVSVGVLYKSDRIWVTCGDWRRPDGIWMYGKRKSTGKFARYVNRVR